MCREKTCIRRDDVKRALVAKAQLEILGVGAIEKPQPHQTGRNFGERGDRSIDHNGIASTSIDDGQGAEVVFKQSI